MIERILPPGEKYVSVAPEAQALLDAVAKSPKDTDTLGKKGIKKLVVAAYNALRKKNKSPVSLGEFIDNMQVKILTAVGDPLIKDPPKDNLAAKGLSVVRRWALMMRNKKLEKKK